ncbi:MAG: nucleotidyl transferase AbiEii/AbiGii toxin family protein [Prosthecobacter sp.]|jgi:hypothetical protein
MNFFSRFIRAFRNAGPKSGALGSQNPFSGFPPTFGKPLGQEEAEHMLVYDPSARQYGRAFRRGDPKLEPMDMARWQQARRHAMQHLLEAATSGSWQNNLVLRGSVTMRAFAGDAAREPGDIDWVVVPETILMSQKAAHEIIDGIIRAVSANPKFKEAVIETTDITQTDIWTYDRAPGRRVAFPWRCAELPPAVIQMDFVFQQKLHTQPVPIEISLNGKDTTTLLSASREESLAWKLLWLSSDTHPQGKDLYDAVLLAEGTTLSASLLKAVFQDADMLKHLNCSFFLADKPADEVDWANFIKECAWVEGKAPEWVERLRTALRPTFEKFD